MAKKIYNDSGEFTDFEPGVIYELRFTHSGVNIPFYVGETTDPERRLAEHIYGAKTATADSENKYQFISNALAPHDIPWTLVPVIEYGAEGPEALEDEHLMALLVDGYPLTNEKKGNANWMNDRLIVAEDMRERGIRSFREYKIVVEKEESDGLHKDRRTPEQIAKLAQIMTGIKGSADEAYAWAIKFEKKQARRRKADAEREKDQFMDRLTGIAQETFKLAEAFPIQEQITLLQGLYLTYEKEGSNPEVLQMTYDRLIQLQELAK
jgi:hypothetical protein